MKIAFLSMSRDNPANLAMVGDTLRTAQPDLLVGPEFAFRAKHGPLADVDKESLLEQLALRTRGSNGLVVPGSMIWSQQSFYHNSCPVLRNGDVLGDVRKHTMKHDDWRYLGGCGRVESPPIETDLAVANYAKSRTFRHGGKDYLVELLDDHLMIACNYDLDTPKVCDVQVVIAGGQHEPVMPERLMVREGGVLVLCNARAYVGRVAGNTLRTEYTAEKKMAIADVDP